VINAAHAIESTVKATGGRGVIRIRSVPELDDVIVSISDTGSGIPVEIQDRIFDPFFTTKEVGKGTGQGLAIARSVIEKHGGRLTFESSERGTTFTVRLPIDGQGVPIAERATSALRQAVP
jgi:two-component system NtrC family sensor kinase